MPTVFIARRDAQRCRQSQAAIEASRDWRLLGFAESLYRARPALQRTDPDALLIDLRLEDGAALSLMHGLREQRAARPKVMLVAADACDPLLFSTLAAGADAYLLEAEMAAAPTALLRMMAGEAAMASPIARQALQFFGEPLGSAFDAALDDRRLDWHTDAANPMRLSPGERRLIQLHAQGLRSAAIAGRMAVSVEAVGRRIGMVYRKIRWDVSSGALALMAA
jgi:DNA-binding NarL/FixJ family response regulator